MDTPTDFEDFEIIQPANHLLNNGENLITVLDMVAEKGLAGYRGLCISSSGNTFPFEPEELIERNLAAMSYQLPLDSNWPRPGWKRFIQGNYVLNPDLMFEKLIRVLKNKLEFSHPASLVVAAIWIIGTYCLPEFLAFPRLVVNGPYESGKSKFGTILKLSCFNGVMHLDMTLANLFRTIADSMATVIIDEAEVVGKDSGGNLNSVLNSGYKRGAIIARLDRVDGKHVRRIYDIFSAVAVLGINFPDTTFRSRSIQLLMRRSDNLDIVNSYVSEIDSCWDELRSDLFVFAMLHHNDIKQIYQSQVPPVFLRGRSWEKWSPLWSIGQYFGVIDPLTEYAKYEADLFQIDVEETTDVQVLRCIGEMLSKHGQDVVEIQSASLLVYINDSLDLILNAKQLGHILTRLDVLSDRRKRGPKRFYVFNKNRVSRLMHIYQI